MDLARLSEAVHLDVIHKILVILRELDDTDCKIIRLFDDLDGCDPEALATKLYVDRATIYRRLKALGHKLQKIERKFATKQVKSGDIL